MGHSAPPTMEAGVAVPFTEIPNNTNEKWWRDPGAWCWRWWRCLHLIQVSVQPKDRLLTDFLWYRKVYELMCGIVLVSVEWPLWMAVWSLFHLSLSQHHFIPRLQAQTKHRRWEPYEWPPGNGPVAIISRLPHWLHFRCHNRCFVPARNNVSKPSICNYYRAKQNE